MAQERKALKFTMDTTRIPVAEPTTPRIAVDQAERQQVGARVTKAIYRRLKSRAALQGVTVQTLVEQAIEDFLSKPEA
jgi:predicted HicB family RNase H-like nuclease